MMPNNQNNVKAGSNATQAAVTQLAAGIRDAHATWPFDQIVCDMYAWSKSAADKAALGSKVSQLVVLSKACFSPEGALIPTSAVAMSKNEDITSDVLLGKDDGEFLKKVGDEYIARVSEAGIVEDDAVKVLAFVGVYLGAVPGVAFTDFSGGLQSHIAAQCSFAVYQGKRPSEEATLAVDDASYTLTKDLLGKLLDFSTSLDSIRRSGRNLHPFLEQSHATLTGKVGAIQAAGFDGAVTPLATKVQCVTIRTNDYHR